MKSIPDHARYLVVFGGARDHYQVALALEETQQLDGLISELYLPAMPRWFRGLVRLIDRMGRSKSRVHAGLPRERVIISWLALAASILNRCRPSSLFVRWKDAALGRTCGRLAAKRSRPVVAYSYYASYVFERMPAGLRKIIFQVHPHPLAVRSILTEELRLCPTGTQSLAREHELNFPVTTLERLSREALESDLVLTPSTFAKQTLIAAGVESQRIAVLPYGIDADTFRRKDPVPRSKKSTLRLIFVGSLVQRKGLSYLLDAVRRLRGEDIELVLAGRGACDRMLLANYTDVPYRLVWKSPRDELVRELQEADVFVFPSLVESFAHVILEAMAVGLPVITTTNTAGPDLLEEGRTGFVGPIRNVDFLVDKIRWFMANREAISIMGRACREEAERRTWSRFRAEIRMTLEQFEKQCPLSS